MLPQKHKAITIYTNPYIQKQKKPNIDKINIIAQYSTQRSQERYYKYIAIMSC